MLPDPLPILLPRPLPLGPSSRYAGLSEAELVAWCHRLSALFDLWWAQFGRFRAMGVTAALGGPCARALAEAREVLLSEAAALRLELEARLAEVRSAVAA
jgi:hypothetical protein